MGTGVRGWPPVRACKNLATDICGINVKLG